MNSARALLDGHITSFAIALLLQKRYGAQSVRIGLTTDDRFQEIDFDQRWEDGDRKKRLFERTRVHRQLSVFTDSMTAGDHADVTKGPITSVRIGPWGHSTEILRMLCEAYGGFFNETDLGDEEIWERIERIEQDDAARTPALDLTGSGIGMTEVQVAGLAQGARVVLLEETMGEGADGREHVYPIGTVGTVSSIEIHAAPRGVTATVVIGPADGEEAIVNVFDAGDASYPFEMADDHVDAEDHARI